VDLAIVTVENDAFWKGAVALAIGVSPRMQQSVDVVGYPMGGDGISITAGIVSRIDWGEYSHSDEKNLVVVSVYFELIVHYISPT
jgi:S1-C subfamily serine protease